MLVPGPGCNPPPLLRVPGWAVQCRGRGGDAVCWYPMGCSAGDAGGLSALLFVLQGSKLQPRAASSAILVLCPLGKSWKTKERRNPARPPGHCAATLGLNPSNTPVLIKPVFTHGKCRR